MSKVILIDGRNCIFRHHFVNTKLSTDEGFPTGALYGCLNSMIALAKRLPDASFVWVWDGGGETWRHRFMNKLPQLDVKKKIENVKEAYGDVQFESDAFITTAVQESFQFLGTTPGGGKVYGKPYKEKPQGYKANRVYSESKKKDENKYPTDERQRALLQIPVLKLILDGAGFRNYEVRGLEGDDLIAILATYILSFPNKPEVIIHSGDRDFYQLLAHHRVKILTKLTEGKPLWVTPDEIEAKYGVRPRNWTKYRAWTGDSGDNIPHLFKVGPKTALKMLDAGMDPSNPDWKHVTEDAQIAFEKYFPLGIENMWQSVHGNYKLCQLVTKIDDDCLSEGVRKQLEQIFIPMRAIDPPFAERNEKCKTPEAYRKVSFLLMQYQLASVLGNLKTLWAIP